MNFSEKRVEMVKLIREQYKFGDEKVLQMMSMVPRHKFAPRKYQEISYDDAPVNIGFGQTMSQKQKVFLRSEPVRGIKQRYCLTFLVKSTRLRSCPNFHSLQVPALQGWDTRMYL